MNIYPMWLSTLEIGAAQVRSVTEIASKSPFLRVNRSPILYSFRAGAKATRHSVNIFLNSLILSRFLKVGPSGDQFWELPKKREFDRVPKPTPQKF